MADRGMILAILLASVPLIAGGCGNSDSKPAHAEKTGAKTISPEDKTKTPLLPKKKVADWCPEHGVPESVCTRCNDTLIAEFKKKGDWCAKHNVPDSQCVPCHPELKEKFEAMKPKAD